MTSPAERGITPEIVAYNKRYASLVKAALGIISPTNPDFLRVNQLAEDPERAQDLIQATDQALMQVSKRSSDLIRAKHGVLSINDQARSFQELRAFARGSTTTARLTYQIALRSLRYGNRLDAVKRVVYPERLE